MRRITRGQVLPGYVDAGQAAELVGVSREQMLRYCRGVGLTKIPAVKIGKSWLIRVEDLKDFERPPMGNPRHRF